MNTEILYGYWKKRLTEAQPILVEGDTLSQGPLILIHSIYSAPFYDKDPERQYYLNE